MAIRKAKRRGTRGNGRRPIGYAVVGLGHIAQSQVLPAFARAKENSRLVAFVSGDPKKTRTLARKYKVEKSYAYEDYEKCLADPEVDAVYIALPNTMHREFTERAARAGRHVLCEKPMAMTAEDCARMTQACDQAKVKLMIAYRLHFEEANLRAIEEVQKGTIGEPRVFNSVFAFQVAKGNIRTDAERGGGVLWDIGTYCVNAARYIFRDEPVEVSAYRAFGDDERFRETEEAASAILRFPEDRLATFTVSFGVAAVARFQVLGTKGSLELDNAYDYSGGMTLRILRNDKTKTIKFRPRDQFAPELIYFSRCIQEDRRPEPDGLEGLADVRVIEALYDSAEAGRRVKLEPVNLALRPGMKQEIRRPPQRKEPPLVDVQEPAQG